MTVKDLSSGPDWILVIVLAFMTILSIVLLCGKGAGLIAGYNTASEEEKNKYDEKKLCRVIGAGMLVITILTFILVVWEAVLPAIFVYIFLALVIIDCVVMIVLSNTICKK